MATLKLWQMTKENLEKKSERLADRMWDHLTLAEQNGYYTALDEGGELEAYLYLLRMWLSDNYGERCKRCIELAETKPGRRINRIEPDRELCASCESRDAYLRTHKPSPAQVCMALEVVYA